ncbi:phosphatase PAP2 family protein [Sphingomonas sp. BN140010]|uniref:Phosphatase PAP2 family protein n=1 Tax=Sphingomonas arvum TaxID=2992113 RepID=A0ABT3JED6_9SPHN|nr:phosphatase PAP2 family protein [Sphingomonas sp. BN140010]MCW3797369.1 phosphatase PAP2 family protein [Sphingomonas sp. BN140010]
MQAILYRLRHGVPADEMQSAFNPATVPVYVLSLLQVGLAILAFQLAGLDLDPAMSVGLPLIPLWLIFSAWAVRRVGHGRIGDTLEAIGLVMLNGGGCMGLILALTTISAPLADPLLASADQALGFNWPAILAALPPGHPSLLSRFYRSFEWQPVLILATLFYLRQPNRAWQLVLAGLVALALTAAIYPFVPALGAYVHFGITPAKEYTNWGTNYAHSILAIKGGQRLVTSDLLAGLVTFPSYHVAAGCIFAWAAWPVRYLRWPMIALNVGMAFSAMFVGGHYFVDLVGGAAVAAASIWIAGLLERRCTPTRQAPCPC